MENHICIHGHFYQPPRENPWLEAIELQESARPYHDWNCRITAECYAPNARSRILDEKNRIIRMVNNYSKMSFNFGPTLLVWMEKNAPEEYEAILEADLASLKHFSGHGSALAQPYNHMIMPLANPRDKETQILWGIRDFEYRYGRSPEGMWLPETAVDLETLQIMAERGILFTILGPHQARRVKPLDERIWQEVNGESMDTTIPYLLRLKRGRSMNLFFYNGAISRAVAFERLLNDGESFVQRLLSSFSTKRQGPQLVHLATDGESYGHHHRFGEMALSYAINAIESRQLAQLTNYGQYLAKHPPIREVEINENTAWSCEHGVERWRDHCGCCSGTHSGWSQEWRRHLREALDWLRGTVIPFFESEGMKLFKDPWQARNAYIEVILKRSGACREGYFREHASHELTDAEQCIALKIMELQRHAMLMYTSCGWFHDDISGVEAIQLLKHAGRVIQLSQEVFRKELEPGFSAILSHAKSNVRVEEDGSRIFKKYAKPALADLKEVGAHHAISSLFGQYPAERPIYCYRIEQEDYRQWKNGKTVLAAGKVVIQSEITTGSLKLDFGVVHLGDHSVSCGIREFGGDEKYEGMVKEISSAFESADFPETIRILHRHFGDSIYSLKSLFRSEQKKILDVILESKVTAAEAVYRQLYENHVPLMRFLKESGGTVPKALSLAAEYAMNADLIQALGQDEINEDEVKRLIQAAKEAGIGLDVENLEYVFRRNLERMAEDFSSNPGDLVTLETLHQAVNLVDSMPFRVNIWSAQNVCYNILKSTYPEMLERAGMGDRAAREWVGHFIPLAEKLSLKIP